MLLFDKDLELSLEMMNTGLIYVFEVINPFPNKPWFLRVCGTSLLKTHWQKEKFLVTNNFSFSHSVFHPFEELSAIYLRFQIVICKLFRFGRVKKFAVWERVNIHRGPKNGLAPEYEARGC